MASVQHPCCSQILAVCMTANMMLVTKLLARGCLLDYVRRTSGLGAESLLRWCKQIAEVCTRFFAALWDCHNIILGL